MNGILSIALLSVPLPSAWGLFLTRAPTDAPGPAHAYSERIRGPIVWIWPVVAGALLLAWQVSPLRRCPAAVVFGPWYLNAVADGCWLIFALHVNYLTVWLGEDAVMRRWLWLSRVMPTASIVSISTRLGRTVLTAQDGRRLAVPASLIDPIRLRSQL